MRENFSFWSVLVLELIRISCSFLDGSKADSNNLAVQSLVEEMDQSFWQLRVLTVPIPGNSIVSISWFL